MVADNERLAAVGINDWLLRNQSLNTMRHNIPVLLAAATVLGGCHSPSAAQRNAPTPVLAAPPPSQPLFITRLGTTNISPDRVWRVIVSPAGDAVEISNNQSSRFVGQVPQGAGGSVEVWSSISVPGPTADSPGWRAHPGWFVFVENASRVWVYDGDRYLCLETDSGPDSAFYPTPRGFPCPVPAQVFSRLSEGAQKSIDRHE